MPSLQEKLKQFRQLKSLTQEEMAETVGIPYRTYQTIEGSGEVKKVAYLDKINAVIGVRYPDKDNNDEAGGITLNEPTVTYGKQNSKPMELDTPSLLTFLNKVLDQNAVAMAAIDRLVKTNEMLAAQASAATAGDRSKNRSTAGVVEESDILMLIAELAAGKLKYPTVEDAALAIHTRFYDAQKEGVPASNQQAQGIVNK